MLCVLCISNSSNCPSNATQFVWQKLCMLCVAILHLFWFFDFLISCSESISSTFLQWFANGDIALSWMSFVYWKYECDFTIGWNLCNQSRHFNLQGGNEKKTVFRYSMHCSGWDVDCSDSVEWKLFNLIEKKRALESIWSPFLITLFSINFQKNKKGWLWEREKILRLNVWWKFMFIKFKTTDAIGAVLLLSLAAAFIRSSERMDVVTR